MEDVDKLMSVVHRMTPAQVKHVIRFAEFLLLEDEPDDLRDHTDVRVRYSTFKDLLQTWKVDPASIDAWARLSGGADNK